MYDHKQNMDHKLSRQARRQTITIEQQVQVLLLLVPPKILLQQLPEQGEPPKGRQHPFDHPVENVSMAQGCGACLSDSKTCKK